MSAPNRCAVCGKLTFPNRQRAEEAAYRLQLDHGTQLRPYAEHDGWHLTGDGVDDGPLGRRSGGGRKKPNRRRPS